MGKLDQLRRGGQGWPDLVSGIMLKPFFPPNVASKNQLITCLPPLCFVSTQLQGGRSARHQGTKANSPRWQQHRRQIRELYVRCSQQNRSTILLHRGPTRRSPKTLQTNQSRLDQASPDAPWGRTDRLSHTYPYSK